MARTNRPRELEQVAMADQVRLHVRARIFEAVADPGLGAQMDDPVEFARRGEALELVGAGEVDSLETKAVAEVLGQVVEPGLLQRWIVISIEVVDADDLLAAFEQNAGSRRADE